MPLFILSILVQVAFVVHIVKTGRNTTWIWIVILLPMAGSIAYFLLEILPGLANSRMGRSARRKVRSAVNPNRDINDAAESYSISNSVENTMRLADECLGRGLYSDAKNLYEKCLVGIHSDDPELMVGLAKTEFMLSNFAKAKSVLDKLIENNPGYKNQDAHLLYARTLESLNEVSAALHEYEVLHDYFSGPDASYYYAMFLKKQNQYEQAAKILEQIIEKAKKSGRHYRTLHNEIIRKAKSEL